MCNVVDLFSTVILDKITKFESCENHRSDILSGLKIYTNYGIWGKDKFTLCFSHDIQYLDVTPTFSQTGNEWTLIWEALSKETVLLTVSNMTGWHFFMWEIFTIKPSTFLYYSSNDYDYNDHLKIACTCWQAVYVYPI